MAELRPSSEKTSDLRPAVTIGLIAACARYSLRLRPEAAERIGATAHLALDRPINTCQIVGGVINARLGPDEWLLLGTKSNDDISETVTNALGGTVHSLVDISHRQLAVSVSGVNAREVLNSGCPLDLDDAAFPPGTAVRTLLGKAEIILLRDSVDSYRVECWRSFAPYLHELLRDAAREFAEPQG